MDMASGFRTASHQRSRFRSLNRALRTLLSGLPQIFTGAVLIRSEVAYEEDPFSLEVDLNDVSRRKKFLA